VLTRAAVAAQAWDCVVDEAVFVAMHLVEAMLHGTPAHVKQRLAELGADIAIIGRNQVLYSSVILDMQFIHTGWLARP